MEIEALAEQLKTPDKFKAWLESKDSSLVVGAPRKVCGCPIASFVGELGGREVSVTGSYIRFTNGSQCALTEEQWVIDFISRIDRFMEAVTAEKSLSVLARVLGDSEFFDQIQELEEFFPVGTQVIYTNDFGKEVETVVRSAPWQVCGTIVIKLSGMAGGVDVERLRLA